MNATEPEPTVECPRCGAMLEPDEECPNHEIEGAGPERINGQWNS